MTQSYYFDEDFIADVIYSTLSLWPLIRIESLLSKTICYFQAWHTQTW